MALYLPVQVQVKANENMIPNNMQRVAATLAIPLSKLAELAVVCWGHRLNTSRIFCQYIDFTLF